MEEQALISQKEYSTVKTMYVLAVFFCVVNFLQPLTTISVAFNYGSDTAISYALWAYPLALLSNAATLFLLFCILLAKGSARKTLLLISMLIFFLSPLINSIINDTNYYMQVYLYMKDFQRPAVVDANSFPLISPGIVISWLKVCLYIFIAVLLWRRYKQRVVKPAESNLLLFFIAVWVGYIIFNYIHFPMMLNVPLFILLALYVVAMVLLGWVVYQKIRRTQNKNASLVSAFFILFIVVYYFIARLLLSSSNIGLNLITSLYSLGSLYILFFAYKAVSDYGFYHYFIESEPKVIIRAKQYVPAEDSVWNQFVTLLRKAFLKTQG